VPGHRRKTRSARIAEGRAGATDAAFLLGGRPPIMPEIERDHAEYEFAYPAQPWHIATRR
jgi:hypothetical protein